MSIGFLDDGTAVSLPCEQVNEALATPGGFDGSTSALPMHEPANGSHRHAPVSETAREVLAEPRRAPAARHPRQRDHRGDAGPAPGCPRQVRRYGAASLRLTERMLITARRTPVHSLEVNGARSRAGRRFPTPIAFLDGVIDQFADAIGRLLGDARATTRRRRTPSNDRKSGDEQRESAASAAVGARAPPAAATHCCSSAASRGWPRKYAAVAAARRVGAEARRHRPRCRLLYDRARLLLDEVPAKVSAPTNRRLFTLSILTACLLPPTW